MQIKEVIKQLKTCDQEKTLQVASDEEWNNIFTNIEINKNSDSGNYIIFGLSGSEIEI